MFEIVKNVITGGRFDLSEILMKIDVLWVQGSLTDDEKTELEELARSKADTGNSIDVIKKLEDLDRRVRVLEGGSAPSEEYPDYIPGKWYYSGDKITFDSRKYICTAPEGQVCTWSPAEYPAYWEEVSE